MEKGNEKAYSFCLDRSRIWLLSGAGLGDDDRNELLLEEGDCKRADRVCLKMAYINLLYFSQYLRYLSNIEATTFIQTIATHFYFL